MSKILQELLRNSEELQGTPGILKESKEFQRIQKDSKEFQYKAKYLLVICTHFLST